MYTFCDKALYFIISKYQQENLYNFLAKFLSLKNYQDLISSNLNLASIGKTQEIKFNILPNIDPMHVNILILTLSILLISAVLILENYNKKKQEKNFLFTKCLLISSFIFFNFGFHVHEKAFIKISILFLIYNFIFFSSRDENENKFDYAQNNQIFTFLLRSAVYVGIFSQMPLIQSKKDYFIKLSLVLSYLLIFEFYLSFRKNIIKNSSDKEFNEIIKKNKNRKRFNIIGYVKAFIFICFSLIILISDFIFVFFTKNDYENEFSLNKQPMYMEFNNTFVAFNEKTYNENILNNLLDNFPSMKGVFVLFEKYEFMPLMIISVLNSIFTQIVNLLIIKFI